MPYILFLPHSISVEGEKCREPKPACFSRSRRPKRKKKEEEEEGGKMPIRTFPTSTMATRRPKKEGRNPRKKSCSPIGRKPPHTGRKKEKKKEGGRGKGESDQQHAGLA